jgi:hypothetical protein
VERSEVLPVARDQDRGLAGGEEEVTIIAGSRQSLLRRGRCAVEALPRLALCRCPAPTTFDHDVATIAAHFGIDPQVLGVVVAGGSASSPR